MSGIPFTVPVQPVDWSPAFYAELRSIMRTQFPAVPDSNYYLVMQSSFDDVVQQIRQAEVAQGTPPPYIVVEVGEFDPIDDMGLQNRLKWAKLRLSYIIKMTDKAAQNLTNQQAVQTDMYLLSEVLDCQDLIGTTVSPQTFRPITNGQIDSSATEPYNAAFRETNIFLWSCSLTYSEGVVVGNVSAGVPGYPATATGNIRPS